MSKGSAELRAMSALDDGPTLSPGVAANAAARLFAQANQLQLANLMAAVERGDVWAAARTARQIVCDIEEAHGLDKAHEEACDEGLLSPRELKVLELVAQGWSNRRVAEALHRSDSTVASQIKSIYRKLSVHSRTQAVHEATRRGLLRPSGATQPRVIRFPAPAPARN
ncbi:response regulator transcription factor [Variovorax sp. Root473]|jgi:DNA-binding NarL/FixJ family response regulator|uniref:response regulator transcription factor n=1 Tax=Variovorax sp. Root473 TaxID=1736541 RepID=UPI0009E862CE|nr:response regulator transcription factor [Variovorax sp. Root473]